jgi:hypothetical protein
MSAIPSLGRQRDTLHESGATGNFQRLPGLAGNLAKKTVPGLVFPPQMHIRCGSQGFSRDMAGLILSIPFLPISMTTTSLYSLTAGNRIVHFVLNKLNLPLNWVEQRRETQLASACLRQQARL